ncbi:MAG: FtsQ-type POTRA domain-containing protein [Nitrospinota bacterium]|nr:FtsQ-type POTRA domain-containing protein [Nitrospinota bacterium]
MSYALLDQSTPGISWETPVRRNKPKRRRREKPQTKTPKRETGKTPANGFLKIQLENLMEILLVTVFCFSMFQGYLFLTQSPHLKVSQVTVNGNHILDEDTFSAVTHTVKGKNIFTLDLPAMARSLKDHPWIRRVSIERQLPGSIHIFVEERTPYARVLLDEIYLMDNYAVLIAPASDEYNHLPLITGVQGEDKQQGQSVATENLMAGLKFMHYLNRLEYFRNDPIDALKLNENIPSVLTTRKRGIKILIDLDTLDESFEDFKLLLDLIDPEKTEFNYIDLSFKDKVVVKPGSIRNTRSGKRTYQGGQE